MPHEVPERPIGHRARLRVAVEARGPREGPEDPRIQDDALVRRGIDAEVVPDVAAKAAERRIGRVAQPEGTDVAPPLGRDRGAQLGRHQNGRHRAGPPVVESSSMRPTCMGPAKVTRTKACPGGTVTS